MRDESVAGKIERLVAREHALRTQEEADATSADKLEADREELRAVELDLDQCWDLLRQRRARRSAGLDPDNAQVRENVQRYLG